MLSSDRIAKQVTGKAEHSRYVQVLGCMHCAAAAMLYRSRRCTSGTVWTLQLAQAAQPQPAEAPRSPPRVSSLLDLQHNVSACCTATCNASSVAKAVMYCT